MKYQYAVGKDYVPQEELWVCGDCRKTNFEMILTGRWQLVSVSSDPHRGCDKCRGPKQFITPATLLASIRSFFTQCSCSLG